MAEPPPTETETETEPGTDAILDSIASMVNTADHWTDVGLACLDQAGVSLRDQDRILAIVQGRA